jgi:hypothetical protein
MNLIDMRLHLRINGRNTNDPNYYRNDFLDTALMRLTSRFQRVTRVAKVVATVDVNAAANFADFSGLAGFIESRIVSARIQADSNYTCVRDDLSLVPAGEVQDKLRGSSTGTPSEMGFITPTYATFYEKPKADGKLTVVYAPLGETPWTPGTMGAYSGTAAYVIGDVVFSGGYLYRAILSSTGTVLTDTTTWQALGAGSLAAPAEIQSVIPDSLVVEVIGAGGPAILQVPDPKQRDFTGPEWQKYLDLENSCRGIGSLAGNSSSRDRGA